MTPPHPQRDLTAGELQAYAAALAADPGTWARRVRHDRDERVYEQLIRDDHVEAYLICWMEDHDTGFHDHDRSAGAVAVVSGAVREDRLALGGPPVSRIATAGDVFGFAAHDIHRVLHSGDEPAVTIHVYSPPLAQMGAYEIAPDGVLTRFAVDADEELRPLESAAA